MWIINHHNQIMGKDVENRGVIQKNDGNSNVVCVVCGKIRTSSLLRTIINH
jgi:hypothetical protein